jgi:hypothetical protein
MKSHRWIDPSSRLLPVGSSRSRALPDRRGSVLFAAIVVVVVLGITVLSFLGVASRAQTQHGQAKLEMTAFYAAEAGLSEALVELRGGGDGIVGTQGAPASFGGLSFWVTRNDLGDGVSSLVATGVDGEVESRVELLVQEAEGQPTDFGIFGEEYLRFASNTVVDSYDSTNGTYASQVVGGHALDGGNVGSNDDIQVDGNSEVYGYAQYGPDADDGIDLAANTEVSEGYGAAEAGVILDPIVVPGSASLGSQTINGGTSQSIGPGTFHYTSLTLKSNSELTVVGPTTLILDAAAANSNSTWIFDASGGPIDVYATGDFQLKSNATITTTANDPTSVHLWLSGVHTSQSDSSPSIEFSSNSQFFGTVHAPDLSLDISSNYEIYGTLRSQWLELSSNSRIHYDQALGTGEAEGSGDWQILAWRQLTGSLEAAE